MATTPPQSSRLRTPPTPLHGPKYDNHEPYSPRRSTRSQRKRSGYLAFENPDALSAIDSSNSACQKFPADEVISLPGPRSLRKPRVQKTSGHTLSPPSSPISPLRNSESLLKSQTRPAAFSNYVSIGNPGPAIQFDSDMEAPDLAPRTNKSGRSVSSHMLLTPAKTPRKRTIHHVEQLQSAARTLFSSEENEVKSPMPSHRKSRKSKKPAASSVDEEEMDRRSTNIQIYTDSRERIPDATDDDYQNPFVLRKSVRKTRNKGAADISPQTTRSMTHYGLGSAVDAAVENGEGMVYVFRGKKIFRKFVDKDPGESTGAAASQANGKRDIQRGAGASAHRPLTRSSIQPRLLFPPAEPVSDFDDVDEEAITDIEIQNPQPNVRFDPEQRVITPTKEKFRPVTPPTTLRKTRNRNEMVTPDSSPLGPSQDATGSLEVAHTRPVRKKSSLFDTWQRTKPTARSVSMKRQGEPLEKTDVVFGKRSKSASHQLDRVGKWLTDT